jgi:hypothetical protein
VDAAGCAAGAAGRTGSVAGAAAAWERDALRFPFQFLGQRSATRLARSLCLLGDLSPHQLLHHQICDAEAATLGHFERHLVVEHAAVHLAFLRVEQLVARTRLAHALQHHLREQRLELTRRLAHRGRIVGARLPLQVTQCLDIGICLAADSVDGHGTCAP